MSVQLGEAFHEESLERAALLLTYDERVKALALVVVALAAAGAANAAVPTPEPVKTGFAVPSRNMVCNAGPYRGGNVLACTIFSEASARGQLLRYGRTWTWHGFRCTSRRTGLTCKNQSGHGFVLSRQSQRVF